MKKLLIHIEKNNKFQYIREINFGKSFLLVDKSFSFTIFSSQTCFLKWFLTVSIILCKRVTIVILISSTICYRSSILYKKLNNLITIIIILSLKPDV